MALLTFGINWYYKRKTTLAQIESYRRWPNPAAFKEE
ncbi:class II holin family protein [Kosakonia sp. CCTCC M2018092]|nr:class II holin family protein [Kosakonia sp. CCTCC M2018092]